MKIILIIFGNIFLIFGGWISIASFIAYFLRPKIFQIRVDDTKISWGNRGREKFILFYDIETIDFTIRGTDLDSIKFYLRNGKIDVFLNNGLMTKDELFEIFQFTNLHFSGKTLLNNA